MLCGDSAGACLQKPDQGHGRAAPACQGVGQCWSASDWQCNQGMAQETVILHCSWRRTFQTCTVNMTALLRALMQHTALITNWILWILLLYLDLILNSCLQRIYIYIYIVCVKVLIAEESTLPNVGTGQFYKNFPQCGKDIIKNQRGCFFNETPCTSSVLQ